MADKKFVIPCPFPDCEGKNEILSSGIEQYGHQEDDPAGYFLRFSLKEKYTCESCGRSYKPPNFYDTSSGRVTLDFGIKFNKEKV